MTMSAMKTMSITLSSMVIDILSSNANGNENWRGTSRALYILRIIIKRSHLILNGEEG